MSEMSKFNSSKPGLGNRLLVASVIQASSTPPFFVIDTIIEKIIRLPVLKNWKIYIKFWIFLCIWKSQKI